MRVKVLFLDDIFSDLFRKQQEKSQLVWDDNWVSAITKELTDPSHKTGITFDLVKSGDIESWRELIETERPEILLLDLFWPEQARAKYERQSRASDISLEALSQIREVYPDLPIVCYTIKPELDLLDRAYRSGATFFLEKVPLPIPEVHSSLRYIFIYLLRKKNVYKEIDGPGDEVMHPLSKS